MYQIQVKSLTNGILYVSRVAAGARTQLIELSITDQKRFATRFAEKAIAERQASAVRRFVCTSNAVEVVEVR